MLPSQVFMGYLVLNVKLYVPRPLRCFRCQRFWHVRDKCRGEVHCPTCGAPHEVANCIQDMKCCNCGGNHSAGFKRCLVYQEAQMVLRVKTVERVTYAEVVKKVKLGKGAVGSSSDGGQGVKVREWWMSGVPSRPLVGISGSDAPAVVQGLPPPEVDWASFSALMVKLGVLFSEGNFRNLSCSDRVSNVVGHVNECMSQRVDGEAVLE